MTSKKEKATKPGALPIGVDATGAIVMVDTPSSTDAVIDLLENAEAYAARAREARVQGDEQQVASLQANAIDALCAAVRELASR